MIAMQYSFTLPADYAMSIIERRIADNGARLDGFPGLMFKTYLYARRDDPQLPSRENIYAPFYLWRDPASMMRFLTSPGFAAVTQAFGRPLVRSWLVNKAPAAQWVKFRGIARRTIVPIAPDEDLTKGFEDQQGDVLAWDAGAWQRLRMDFLNEPLQCTAAQFTQAEFTEAQFTEERAAQYYRIGYVATSDVPGAA